MSISLSDADTDFSKLKVAELKLELKKRGLSTDGKKNDLVERLQASIGNAALLDDAHDDLLDDLDDVLNDSAIEPSFESTETKGVKRAAQSDDNPQPKKIILNRKVIDAPDPPVETPEPAPPIVSTDGPKIVAKIGSLSMLERLEKRKARFLDSSATATPITTTTPATNPISVSETAKQNRAARFGSTNTSIDVLKKRAERFGTVAPVLEKVQLEEKKLQRMQRFGNEDKSSSNGADKKALRAARFQITL